MSKIKTGVVRKQVGLPTGIRISDKRLWRWETSNRREQLVRHHHKPPLNRLFTTCYQTGKSVTTFRQTIPFPKGRHNIKKNLIYKKEKEKKFVYLLLSLDGSTEYHSGDKYERLFSFLLFICFFFFLFFSSFFPSSFFLSSHIY